MKRPSIANDASNPIIQTVAGSTGIAAGVLFEQFTSLAGTGSYIAVGVQNVLAEFGQRALSARQQTRIGQVLYSARNRISARITNGDELRKDKPWVANNDDKIPSNALTELLEAVLISTRDEYEERKLQYLSNFMANVLFREDVSLETAHLLLRQFDLVSYRQMCILAIVGEKHIYDVEPLRKPIHTDFDLETLKREEMNLHTNDLGILGLLTGEGPWSDKLSTLGKAFYELAALNELQSDEKSKIENTIEALRKE